jgi:trehalose/maltose hydrolase-like predicted phosphorylase
MVVAYSSSSAAGFGGFRVHGRMTVQPWLPPGWKTVGFRLRWRGTALSVTANHTTATFVLSGPGNGRSWSTGTR